VEGVSRWVPVINRFRVGTGFLEVRVAAVDLVLRPISSSLKRICPTWGVEPGTLDHSQTPSNERPPTMRGSRRCRRSEASFDRADAHSSQSSPRYTKATKDNLVAEVFIRDDGRRPSYPHPSAPRCVGGPTSSPRAFELAPATSRGHACR